MDASLKINYLPQPKCSMDSHNSNCFSIQQFLYIQQLVHFSVMLYRLKAGIKRKSTSHGDEVDLDFCGK